MASAIRTVPQVSQMMIPPRAGAIHTPKFIVSVRTAVTRMFDPYRPERHYMRGPGPKWRAKHGIDAGA